MARFLFYDDKIINLLLQDEKPCGGSAVQTYGWIRGLMEEGQEVFVMTDTNDKGLLKEDCRHIKLVPMYKRNRGVRWLRWLYYRLPYTYKKIRSVKPDYLYLSIPGWTSFLFAIICRLLQIRFIQRISNDNQLHERFRKDHSTLHQFFMNLGLRVSDHILCQNNFQLQLVRKKFPGKAVLKITNPVYLKPDGLVSAFSSRRYIAWVGIYRSQKNLQLLFQIACILKNEQFVVAGREGANCDVGTRYFLQRLKELPNVKFCGYVERKDMLPFLANASFLLNTSHYEGFSNTFLEAWSVGTPVLSHVHVNPDSIISKYDLGIIYKDVFDLCKKCAGITPELYQFMSANTLEYVSRCHDFRALSRELLRYLSTKDNIIAGVNSRLLPMAGQTIQEQFLEHEAE